LIAIFSAFVWLLQLFATAGVWAAVPFLKTSPLLLVLVGVAAQEATRFGLFVGYCASERRFLKIGVTKDEFPLTDFCESPLCSHRWLPIEA
jgi:hypothetical protein